MNLRKSDKVIAIIGVIILVVAAITIIYYVSEDENGEEPTTEEEGYTITWEEKLDTKEILNENVGEELYAKPFTIKAMKDGSVITEVNIRVVWVDNNVYGGLGNIIPPKGQDKLIAKITLEGGEAKETPETTGQGNETLNFFVNEAPSDYTITEAKDINEAMTKVLEDYLGMNTATFNVEVTLTIGEKFRILRPLASLINVAKDNGNDFSLYITYTYWEPTVNEDDTNDDSDLNKETGKRDDPFLPTSHTNDIFYK